MHCFYTASAHMYSADSTASSHQVYASSRCQYNSMTPIRQCADASGSACLARLSVRCHSVLGDEAVRPNATTWGGSRAVLLQSCSRQHSRLNQLVSQGGEVPEPA